MTYDEIKSLIDAFRAETQQDAITPDSLGQLIQKILDYASDEGIISEGLQELIDAKDDALEAIDTAQETAVSEIETLLENFDLTYEELT